MAQSSSFTQNPCRWLHFPCLGDGNFSALLPVSIMVHFSPETLKTPVSHLVTINPHFLSCFKLETTSFALFFASSTAPPAFLPEIVFLLCISPDMGWDQCSSCDPSLHSNFSCVSKWGGFWCSPQHPLSTTCPFHHLQELFHIVYVTSRAQIPIFHQDPLIQTPGNLTTALITAHFEYRLKWVPLTISAVWTQMHSLWTQISSAVPYGFELRLPKPFLWAGWNSGTDTGARNSLSECSVVP